MLTPANRMKQAQIEIDRAIAKRNLADKLWAEADEELTQAHIKMEDARLDEIKIRKQAKRRL